jgi:intracellular multiplication protein IcmD
VRQTPFYSGYFLLYKKLLKLIGLFGVFYSGAALAQGAGAGAGGGGAGGTNIGLIASNITGSFESIGRLILAVAFLGGIGFIMAAIFKFKQHKDNPTQVPLGTPIAMLVIGAFLVFMPGIVGPAGSTIFGASPTAGGFSGAGVSIIPGVGS